MVAVAVRNYCDLVAWQKAMDLVEIVYKATSQFPKEEVYGLTNQSRRAAVSVPSNIAEGQGRRSDNDFRRFLAIGHGSLREVETQVLDCSKTALPYGVTDADIVGAFGRGRRLITGLINSIDKQN